MPTCIAAHSYSQSFWSIANTPLRGQALICVIETTPLLTRHLHLYTVRLGDLNFMHQLKLCCLFPIQFLLLHGAYFVRHNSGHHWFSHLQVFLQHSLLEHTLPSVRVLHTTLYLRNLTWPLNSNRLTVRQELF